jgi:hypothetical protein
MLSPVDRTIILTDDDGGALTVNGVSAQELAAQRLSADQPVETGPYPDTLELIHRPDPVEQPDLTESEQIIRSAPEELEQLLQRFRDERRHRRSVRAAKVLVAGLAAGLLAIWLLHPPEQGGDENRAQTAFPAFTPSGVVSGSNARQLDAALRDRLALREYVVKAIGETSRDKLNSSLTPQVVLGSTGVPFLSEDFTDPCQYNFDPAAVNAGLSELTALAKKTGKTITVAIAPDKSSILSDELGSRGGALMACSNNVREQTEQTWKDQATSPVLTTWTQLAAEQKQDPGRVFQRGDSHWTSQGGLIWSQALISHLVVQGDAPAALQGAPIATEGPDQPADNDLYRLMGITRAETVPVWTVHRSQVKVKAHSKPSPSGRGIGVFQATSTSEPLIKGRTLIINDSFISRAEGLLAPYFSNLQIMHWSDFMTAVSKGDVPHFDRIIIETVQRGWPQRAGWLQDGQPIHDALAKELSTPSRTTAQQPKPTDTSHADETGQH